MKTTKATVFLAWSALYLLSAVAHAQTCANDIPPGNPVDIYSDHGDGTVTDLRTGLMWTKCGESLVGENCDDGSIPMTNWETALDRAEDHVFAGYDDWRLPNVKELQSLVEYCRSGPAINESVFPWPLYNANSLSERVLWTSSPHTQLAGEVWTVDFADGRLLYSSKDTLRGLRLVRGGGDGAAILTPPAPPPEPGSSRRRGLPIWLYTLE